MHMGTLQVLILCKKNFKHILLNNYTHEFVGGQKQIQIMDFEKLSKSLGYKNYLVVKNKKM